MKIIFFRVCLREGGGGGGGVFVFIDSLDLGCNKPSKLDTEITRLYHAHLAGQPRPGSGQALD